MFHGKRLRIRPAKLLARVVAVVAMLAAHGGCHSEPPEEPPERPNILLIVVDTLRADSISCYGYDRPTSPFLDKLAAEGVRFDRAYAPCSWTVPSVASMLSSTYINQHGLGKRFRGADGIKSWSVIPNDVPSLAQLLSDGGYRTFGLVANINLPAERGFARGFGRYECLGSVDIGPVRSALSSWMPEIGGAQEPWFFWLHLFDPRMNGMPPTKFAGQVKKLTDREVAVAKACYDSEIRAADDLIRYVLENLPGADDAFVLFTSDHGEEFREHGGALHGGSLYDEQIRVPFIVRAPDRRSAGTVVTEPVSLVDVLPTLLGAAGIEAPPEAVGLNLMPPDGVHVPEGREVFAELRAFRAVISARWKLIATMGKQERDMLFDLRTDPGERHNLAAGQADRVESKRELIAHYEKEGRQAAPERIDIDHLTLERLKALGYTGGGG
jgi:arylsulfatase A-like enzyme